VVGDHEEGKCGGRDDDGVPLSWRWRVRVGGGRVMDVPVCGGGGMGWYGILSE
jgi:hypothetical protein